MRQEMDNVKKEMQEVLETKINENHRVIEESARRMDALIKEANQLWTFFQKFIDEHSVDRERLMYQADIPIVRKMEALEWLSRYSEFISPEYITKTILAFKDVNIKGSNKDEYVKLKHQSNAVLLCCNYVEKCYEEMRSAKDKETMQQNESKLAILLSILEPLIINNKNLELLVDTKVFDVFTQLIESQDLGDQSYHIYLKFAMRCLTSALRHQRCLSQFTNNTRCYQKVQDMETQVSDQEIVANAKKIMKIIQKKSMNQSQPGGPLR